MVDGGDVAGVAGRLVAAGGLAVPWCNVRACIGRLRAGRDGAG